jgi:hypothetical protein
LLIDIGGICGVEGNPQEDKASIDIIGLLGAIEPTQGAVHAQSEVGMVTFTFLAMTGLEYLMVHERSILECGAICIATTYV